MGDAFQKWTSVLGPSGKFQGFAIVSANASEADKFEHDETLRKGASADSDNFPISIQFFETGFMKSELDSVFSLSFIRSFLLSANCSSNLLGQAHAYWGRRRLG